MNLRELSVGERCALTVPTRFAFANAGYPEVLKKHRVKALYFDEVRQAPVELRADGRLRDRIWVPEPVLKAGFLFNLPKFKAHPWSRLTLSLKNFIGLQDNRHRLIDHNIFLEHKIADLQAVIQPKFIAVDGIVVGQVDRPLAIEPDERVIFAGDCVRWEGEIHGRPVKIESSYKRPSPADGYDPPSNDLLLKTVRTLWNCFRQRRSSYVRARGCTVSIADLIHYISAVGGVGNVNFDPRLALPLNVAYWRMRIKRFLNQLVG